MDYSAATAPMMFGKTLFTLPALLAGAGILISAISGKVKPHIGLAGAVFVLAFGWLFTSDAVLTLQCRRAAAEGQGLPVSGQVSSIESSVGRNGEESVSFSIGEQRVSTWVSGMNNECGFVQSAGRTYRPVAGQPIQALLFDGRIVRLTVR